MDQLGIRNVDTGIGFAGVGFVVIPDYVDDKNAYIENCYRTNTITINGGMGYGYFSGVNVDSGVMKEIQFPTDESNRGTPVVWIRDSISQLPVVVACLRKQNEYYPMGEQQYRFKKTIKEKNIEVFVDANEASVDLVVKGDRDIPSNLTVRVVSPNSDSVVNLLCDGNVNVVGDNSVNVSTNKKVSLTVSEEGEEKIKVDFENGVGFTYKDEYDNEITAKEGKVNVKSERIDHNDGKEPMVLGDTLEGLLNDLLSAIINMTFMAPSGSTSTPVNTAEFQKIKNKIKEIKSELSFLE